MTSDSAMYHCVDFGSFYSLHRARVELTKVKSDRTASPFSAVLDHVSFMCPIVHLSSKPPLACNMAANPLDVATDLAGVDLNTDVVARYLRRIGIKSHATISTYLHDNAAINDLIAKLKAGVQVGDTEFKLADSADEDALKAPWIHAYQSAMTSTASPSTSTPPPTTTTSTTDRDTVPKSLPAGVYTKLVQDYNDITIDGEKRQFPERNPLGAEKVLARMYHEHHTSKLYTATSLRKTGTCEDSGCSSMPSSYTMGLDSSQVRHRDRGQSVRRLVHQARS